MSNKFPCMLAHKFDAKRIKSWPVAVEPKLDGVRCVFVLRNREGVLSVETLSRAGKPFTSVVAIENSLKLLYVQSGIVEDIVLDGELRCGDTFKSTVSAIKRKSVQAVGAVFTVFDLIPAFVYFGDAGKFSEPWAFRRIALDEFVGDVPCDDVVLSKVRYADSEQWIMDLYAEYRAEGHEGAIVKTCDSLWSPRRSYAYMKLKAHESEDLTIIGAVEGEGRLVGTLGKLLVARRGDAGPLSGRLEPGQFVTIGVGTGLSDAERDELWAQWNANTLVGKVCEVGYHEVTPEGSLRHPVYMGIRIDK